MNFGFRFSAPVPAQKQISPKAAAPIFIALPAIFIVLGTLIFSVMLRDFLYERSLVDRAVEVPCEIVSAEIETDNSSNGVSYSPAIAYEYQYNFQEFASETIAFSSGFSSGKYADAKKRLNELKNRTTCWVDPDDPSRAALERPSDELSWSKILPLLFPLVFVAFGVFFLVAFLRALRREKANVAGTPAGTPISENFENSENPENSENSEISEISENPVPAEAEPPLWLAKIVSLISLAFPTIWFGAACYFMVSFIRATWPENTPISAETFGEFFSENFMMLIFSGSFVVVGLAFLATSIRQFLADRRAAERSRDEAFARNRGKWER